MSSFVNFGNKRKNILILNKRPTVALDNTTLTAEKEYSTMFTEQEKKICLSLYYYGVINYTFASYMRIYKFKAKETEINAGLLSGTEQNSNQAIEGVTFITIFLI